MGKENEQEWWNESHVAEHKAMRDTTMRDEVRRMVWMMGMLGYARERCR